MLDVLETFHFIALQKKAHKYRPYDGSLTPTERSVITIIIIIIIIVVAVISCVVS